MVVSSDDSLEFFNNNPCGFRVKLMHMHIAHACDSSAIDCLLKNAVVGSIKVACTSGPISTKITSNPIFSVQIIHYQVAQMYNKNMIYIISKFHFNSFNNGIFVFFFIFFNVNIYRVLSQKIKWKPLNCGIFFEKVYMRLNWQFFLNSVQHNISI